MTYRPTGHQVFITGRDQHANRREARYILTAKVNEFLNSQKQNIFDTQRKNQMTGQGSIGKRGEKIRTYNFIQSRVVDHRLGLRTSNIKEVMKGNFSVLFNQK